jgi:DNA-binding CsgD family transcriptional regulator
MEYSNRSRNVILTERENEVLKYLAYGFTAKEIADILCISVSTVVTHCEHLKRKILAKNTTELIFKAVKLGLL